MFYRQKILLALIESYGGKLSKTDLEKLLFLFCQTTQQNHYDFFPHKYGPFSFMSYYDKDKLIQNGLLKDADHFELTTSSHIDNLRPQDRRQLQNFNKDLKLHGKQLIKKVYLDYPQYASKSQIVKKILTPDEYQNITALWKANTQQMLFTIGYEGNSIDHYLNRLIQNNVQALIDVRKNPLSRKHGFSKRSLQTYLKKVGIQYYHLSELGIPSDLRKNLNGQQSYQELFNYYAAEILPIQTSALDKIKNLLHKYYRTALTCFEAEHQMCHRHKITELFEADRTWDIPITNI